MEVKEGPLETLGEDVGIDIDISPKEAELDGGRKSLAEQYEDVEENMAATFTSACDEHDRFTGLPFEYLGRSQREGHCGGVQPLFRVKFSSGEVIEAIEEEVSRLTV